MPPLRDANKPLPFRHTSVSNRRRPTRPTRCHNERACTSLSYASECLQARPCPQAPSAPSAVSRSLCVDLLPIDDPLGPVTPALGL